MSIDVQGVERLRLFKETTFGADSSGSVGSYVDARYLTAGATLNTEMLPDQHTVQRRTTENVAVIGRKSADLALNMHIAGTGVVLDASAGVGAITTPTVASLILMKALFGGYRADDGSVEDGGTSTTGVIDVAAGTGSDWTAGAGIGVQVTAGIIEAREVASISTDALTLNTLLSGTPATSEEVYNAHTIYVAEDPSESLAFVLEAADRDNIFWMFGCNGAPSLDIPLHQLPMLSAAIRGAEWLHDDAVVSGIDGSVLAAATYTDGPPVPFVKSEVLFAASGGTTRTPVHVSGITVTPAWDVQPVSSPGGVNGVARWRHRRASPLITGSFTTYWDTTAAQDDVWFTARDNKTPYKLQIQVGQVPGGTVLVSLPNLQIMDVQKADSEGLHGLTVSWKALEDANTTDLTTEIRRSPIRIHLL